MKPLTEMSTDEILAEITMLRARRIASRTRAMEKKTETHKQGKTSNKPTELSGALLDSFLEIMGTEEGGEETQTNV